MVRTEQDECLLAIEVAIGCIERCTALASQLKNCQLGAMMVCVSRVHGCLLLCDAHRPITSHQLKNVMRVVRI
jgi:hypothetical protein